MAQGLQVFDENGNCTFGSANRYARVIGKRTLMGSGSITADSLGVGDVKLWYMILVPSVSGNPTGDKPLIKISDSGKEIIWKNINHGKAVILLGVY